MAVDEETLGVRPSADADVPSDSTAVQMPASATPAWRTSIGSAPGRRTPPQTLEKVTTSVTFAATVTLTPVTVLACFVPWGWAHTLPGLLAIVLDLAAGAMALWTLVATVTANPYADPRWVPSGATEDELRVAREQAPAKEAAGAKDKIERAIDYYDPVSYCSKCEAYKPPRCHHCRHCGRCTLCFDHHCRWVGACIGHANHRTFLQFLFYATLATCAGIAAFFVSVRDALAAPVLHVTPRVAVCTAYLVAMVYLSVALFSMVRDQLYTLARGETLVEHAIHNCVRHYEPDFTSPYQRGFWANLRAILGPDPRLWLLPLRAPAPPTAGYVYDMNPRIPPPFYAGVHLW